jgi:hypothetical protein
MSTSCSHPAGCDCGCCGGITVATPQAIQNPRGQPSIGYRVGTWATFRESMLARLSSSDYPALGALRTRDTDDFTIAFLDASAVVFDILTFYQERLANESYLRTAGQLRSLIELARLIGYQPSPGVAASTYLAFTLKAASGHPPDPSNPAITIPPGTQVQSVPPQGQAPQTFETSADILAKSDWNALPVQTGIPWTPAQGDAFVYLDGTNTQLQPGDAILIVGDERKNPQSAEDWNRWDIRIVLTVYTDTANSRTRISWNEGLGAPDGSVPPAAINPKIFALRQRAALFGYNALNPNMLDDKTLAQLLAVGALQRYGLPAPNYYYYWSGYQLYSDIDLDGTYPKIAQGGWVALVYPDFFDPKRSLSGYINLYQASSVSSIARSDFGQSAKITRVAPDRTDNLDAYSLPDSLALVQSELLPTTIQPLDHPLYGTLLDLDALRPDLLKAQVVALFGKAQKIVVPDGVNGLQFTPDDLEESSSPTTLKPGDELTLTNPAALPLNPDQSIPNWRASTDTRTLSVLDAHGRPGSVSAALSSFILVASTKNDPVISEYAVVVSVNPVRDPYPHTQIVLKSNLSYCYERAATTVNANVALATHGSSVSEIMGSGSAATPNQSFGLKQSPLTFVPAATASGSKSTLQVRASGVQWTEVPSLYNQPSTGRIFATLNQTGGNTTALFGDGVEGATLPSGQNNVQAQYRVGLGAGGNVAGGTLTTLMDRPLGVSGVTNPEAATGGQDAAMVDDLRSDAPQTVLTLGRAVSIADYQNFASGFAGIAKAYAMWTPAGPGRGVFLTVAGVGGAALQSGNPTLGYLVTALQNYGNPLVPLFVQSFLETLFGLAADVAYDPAYDAVAVEAQVRRQLTSVYSFAGRTFGQGISMDEVAAVIQNIPGVRAVNVKTIYTVATSAAGDLASRPGGLTVTQLNAWLAQQVTLARPASDSPQRICAYLPLPNLTALPQPAEILVLHPDPRQVTLGVMS